MLRQEIDERAHACRERGGVADIDGVDVFAVAGIVALQYRDEAAGLDVGANMEEREAGEAYAAEAEATGGFAVARARDGRGQGLLGVLATLERPAADAAREGPADPAVIGEVGWNLRRASASEIFRRADLDHAAGGDLSRDQT